ncbi:MAG TPA: DNA-binding protein, partial [Thermoanaerobaculia bacterium]|nr:DNA-binding protein [Thermoanaerobaculia bacterium]
MTDQQPQRLDSWKDIAAYLKRDVSTVQRWEKREGMPVHRHQHDKLGSVYAFPAELDAWAQSRRVSPEAQPEPPGRISEPPPPEKSRTRRILWLAAGIAVIAIVLTAVWASRRPEANPLADARFIHLTDFEGTEQAAAISRDGRVVAFLSDRDGAVDVWVTQVGTGQFHNLTRGRLHELVNPDIRMLGFSPDGALVTVWVRRKTASGTPSISIWAIPILGGEPRLYLEGVAEFDWSSDGKRLVYHTPAPGDPMFVKDEGGAARPIFTAPEGIHNHYLSWSPDDRFIYFIKGTVPSENDVWRMDPASGAQERLTTHDTRASHPTFLDRRTLLYLATDADGGGPWLYALDPDRRESRRISFGVERYASLSA